MIDSNPTVPEASSEIESPSDPIAWRDEQFYCRWLDEAGDVARYLRWAGDRNGWTSDGRAMLNPIDDKHGVPLLGGELRRFRALQRLLDEMENEGLLASKVYPDGQLRRSLTEKGKAQRSNLTRHAEDSAE